MDLTNEFKMRVGIYWDSPNLTKLKSNLSLEK